MQFDEDRSVFGMRSTFSVGLLLPTVTNFNRKFIAARNVTYFHKMNRIVTPDQPRCSVDNVAKRFEPTTG